MSVSIPHPHVKLVKGLKPTVYIFWILFNYYYASSDRMLILHFNLRLTLVSMMWKVFDILYENVCSWTHILRDSWKNWRTREPQRLLQGCLVSIQNNQAAQAGNITDLATNTRSELKMLQPSLLSLAWGRTSRTDFLSMSMTLVYSFLHAFVHLWTWSVTECFEMWTKKNGLVTTYRTGRAYRYLTIVSIVVVVSLPSFLLVLFGCFCQLFLSFLPLFSLPSRLLLLPWLLLLFSCFCCCRCRYCFCSVVVFAVLLCSSFIVVVILWMPPSRYSPLACYVAFQPGAIYQHTISKI